MRRLPLRRTVILVALACQILAGSLSTLSTAHAAANTNAAPTAHCHDAGPAESPAGTPHPCGCDGGACKCPCLHIAPLLFATVAFAPSLTSAETPPPAITPHVPSRNNPVFRPPI